MATYGIDKKSQSSTYNSIWRSERFNVGRKFNVVELRIPLGLTIVDNMEIVPKLYFDDDKTSVTLGTINSTNFSGQSVTYKQPTMKSARGNNNFILELNWGGTVGLPVIFPISITLDINEDEA